MRELNSKCILLTPCYDHVDRETDEALRAAESAGYHVWRAFGISAIDQARIHMANHALERGYQELVWIDGDIGFNVQDIAKLRAHNLPIVTAICAQKDAHCGPCIKPNERTDLSKPLTEVDCCGCGLLYTKAEVYLEIAKEIQPCVTRWGRQVPYFMPCIENGIYLGEDFAFGRRARQVGFSIYADTTLKIKHFGRSSFMWKPPKTS